MRMASEPRDKRIIFPVSQAELDAIDDWRFEHRMPSRSEAIRELIRRALDALASKVTDKPS